MKIKRKRLKKSCQKFWGNLIKPLAISSPPWYSIVKISKGVSPMGHMELIEHRSGAVPA